MTGKIYRAILAAAGCVLLASFLITFGFLSHYFAEIQTGQLWAELDMAAAGVESAGMDYWNHLSSDSNRLTWIAADGSVLYDGQADEHAMENHASREEVQEAFATGTGVSQRYSDTLLEKTLYCAKRLPDGSVLRISVSTASLAVLVLGMLRPICIVVLGGIILSFLLANRLSRRIVEPLNALDLEHPLENQTYDELAPLLRRINQQHGQIDAQMRILQQKTDEFAQITASMTEGLVLLDNRDCILSINPAAAGLFHTEASAVGQDFLSVERDHNLQQAIAAAREQGHSEISLNREGRIYQLDASSIVSEQHVIGVVLLVFDVTEKVRAEQTRREFTANVSHELKTPLTAILGSSELLQSGLVKQEDLPRFIEHIHSEAARLLTLIEDILRLSQLDEGVALPQQTVDLAAVAAAVAQQLREKAAQNQVTLTVDAEPCPLQGVPQLFQEIIHNLTDNAIKYNVPGGSVTLTVTKAGVLTVADTGIGIPAAHHSRVFERFYRVDKSHSREIGGTGLGLSIVKHAVAVLHGSIQLQSVPDQGTTITVTFPLPGDDAAPSN